MTPKSGELNTFSRGGMARSGGMGRRGLGHDGGTGNTRLCLFLYLFQYWVHGKNINFRFRIISILVLGFYHESAV